MENLSAEDIVALAKDDPTVWNALLHLPKLTYLVLEDPTVDISKDPSIENFSDEYITKRAEFFERVVADDNDTVNSYSPYSYYDTDLNVSSIGGGTTLINFGDSNTQISGKQSTYLFGSTSGNKDDEIKGSIDNHTKDYVEGLDGSDRIYTYGGDDIIYTNANKDDKYDNETSTTDNYIYAGDGDDKIYGSKGTDEIYGDSDDATNAKSYTPAV